MPVEIRQAIYAQIFHGQTHAFLWQGRIQLSACLQPNLGDDRHDGRERVTTTHWRRDDPGWARRLRSTWGVHWECEEAAYRERTDLREHRRYHTFLDACNVVVKTTAINVTDIDTLEMLLLKPNELISDSNCAWNLRDYISPRIRKLNIAFRLPLAFYEVLQKDEDEDLVLVVGPHTRAVSVGCAAWERLWPAICQLPQLRSLHIWLDHDDRPSWSFVNERVAMRPMIAALLARTQAHSEEETMPHMDVALNLPKLHPHYAKPDTHYFQESSSSLFTIERRIRQRWHCQEGPIGNLKVEHKADFPVLHELPDFIIEQDRCSRRVDGVTVQEEDITLEEEKMTLEEVERLETQLWENGAENVYEFMSSGFHHHTQDEDTYYSYSRRFPGYEFHGP
ncbi:hypothetical protein V499_08799 [Pseudogymnoascus sp. VKM F-103]|nr:hypothetical protein V499_08799 [Pseudogymnoascus sp. VKM F-103]